MGLGLLHLCIDGASTSYEYRNSLIIQIALRYRSYRTRTDCTASAEYELGMGAIWPRPQTKCYAIMSSQMTYASLSLDSAKPTEEAGKRNDTRQARRTMSKVREFQGQL